MGYTEMILKRGYAEMRLKKGRKILIWYLTALLFVFNFNTKAVHAASEVGHYGEMAEEKTTEAPAAAPEVTDEHENEPPSDTDQEVTELYLDSSGDSSSIMEEWETDSWTEPSAGTESSEHTGEIPEHTEAATEAEETESPESFTEAEQTTEDVTEMETETPTETGDLPETETLPESAETEESASETELLTEELSEHEETALSTEVLTTESELQDSAEETVPTGDTEFPETEPEESETEKLSLEDHSALFELLQSWWESMQLAFVTKILQLILAFVLFFVGRRVINTFIRLMDKMAERKGWDPTVCSFARNAARAVLYLALIMAILTCVGVEVASLAAIISSIGVALGLALQGSLSNLAGGLLLAIMKPIHLGDFINASGYAGTVSEIGLVYTTLVGADDRTVVIPNSTLMSSVIENYSKQTTRRVEVQCPISYEADLKLAMNIFDDVLRRIPERLPDKPVNVFISSFGDSGIVLEGQIYVEWTQYLSALWKVREKIKLSFDEAGIEIPLPQIVVSQKQENMK